LKSSSIFVVLVDKLSFARDVRSAHLSNTNHFLVQRRGKIPLSEASDGSYQPISDESTISRQEHPDHLLLLGDGPWLE